MSRLRCGPNLKMTGAHLEIRTNERRNERVPLANKTSKCKPEYEVVKQQPHRVVQSDNSEDKPEYTRNDVKRTVYIQPKIPVLYPGRPRVGMKGRPCIVAIVRRSGQLTSVVI